MLVDDEVRILRFAALVLKNAGYDVITETLGEKAVELAQSAKPDIIVLDILMPDVDGFEVLKRIRAFWGAPVLAFSARSGVGDKAIESGANDYLAKPFDPNELVRRISALLPPDD